MTHEIKTPVGFTVFIDEEIYDTITMMAAIAVDLAGRIPKDSLNESELRSILRRLEAIHKLIDVVSDKGHELGWCKDPECDYKK